MAEAKVTKIESLNDYSDALARYQFHVSKVVDEIGAELIRITRAIESEIPEYWKSEFRTNERRLVEASNALSQCMSQARPGDSQPCTEHRKRVEKLKLRKRLIEERSRQIKSAIIHWGQTEIKIKQRVQQCRNTIDSSLPNARTQLLKIIETLEKYSGTNSASTAPPTTTNPNPEN